MNFISMGKIIANFVKKYLEMMHAQFKSSRLMLGVVKVVC